ncbi:MAG: TonB-dependent receptor plug domain-containing protein, partial [Bacteroidota bacterium]
MKRNIKYYLIAFSFIMLNAEIYSQNAYVSGFVNAANSEDPLIGATVYYTSGQGTTTNYNGFYELSIPAGTYELLASYVGYEDFEQTIELKAGDSIKLDLTLQFEPSILNTVTVTSGRSETLLSEATVSLEVIKPNLIESTNKLSLDKAVEKIPGVSVVDGQANIRGGSGYSFGAGSRVLLLQDDVPVLQLDAAFPNWYDLPIEHTDQIEVLKGAASSLYGSAAMNGIIHFRTAFATSEPITKVSLSHNIIGNPKDAAEGEQWWDDAPYTFAASLSHRQKFGKYDLVAGGYYFNEQSHIHDV